MVVFNTDGMVLQRFPFRASMMNYIFDNLQPHHLIKLYQTCKFFFAKYRLNIIQHLEIADKNEPEILHPSKTVISIFNPFLPKLADFWITESFTCRAPLFDGICLPFFDRCTIKKLELNDYILWEHFEMLTESGTIEEMKIDGIFGILPNILASVDKIVAQVPNATSIEIGKSHITADTTKALLSLEHKAKFTHFVLRGIDDYPVQNVKYLITFMAKNSENDFNLLCKYELPNLAIYNSEIYRHFVETMKMLEKEYNYILTELVKSAKNGRVFFD